MSSPDARHHEFEVVQEDDRVAARVIVWAFALSIAIGLVAVAIAYALLSAQRASMGVQEAPAAQVAPRQIDGIHQTPIERDRHGWELRERQRKSLEGYRWIDRARGVAQIPIDEAMQIVIDEASRADAGAPEGGAP